MFTLSIFKINANFRLYSFGLNFKLTKTSQFCSIHQENMRKSCLHSNLIILIDLDSFTVNEEKLQNSSIFKISAKVVVHDLGQNMKMTKISEFFSFHQENTCKSCLHSNLIIVTDFHSFTVNEERLQNSSIFKISAMVTLCDSGQNLKMTKTS